MPTVPRIFISHSSKDRLLTEEVCKKLGNSRNGASAACEPIVDFDVLPNYDVLVDITELEFGMPWPKQLHEWMAKCHAALILLTKNAAVSPWVLKEATILAWRLSQDKNFRLFVTQFPDVTKEMLSREKFDPLMLDQIQEITSYDPSTIGQNVCQSIGQPVAKQTSFDELAGRLADLFATVGDNTLKAVAQNVRVEEPQWRPDRDIREQYTEEIARHLVCEDLGQYQQDGVQKLISDLGLTTPAETLKDILRIISPYWVDVGAAGKLAPLLSRERRQAAALNGQSVGEFTARMYVNRAHPLDQLYYSVIQTAGGSAGDLVAHYKKEIFDHFRKRQNYRTGTDEAIIKHLARSNPRYYVVLPPPVPDNDSLRELMSTFPKLTFILWTGETLDHDESLSDVSWLTPEVDLDREEEEYWNWVDAIDVIKQKANR